MSLLYNDFKYDSDTCKRISEAIKRSRIFADVRPLDLLQHTSIGTNSMLERHLDNDDILEVKKMKITESTKPQQMNNDRDSTIAFTNNIMLPIVEQYKTNIDNSETTLSNKKYQKPNENIEDIENKILKICIPNKNHDEITANGTKKENLKLNDAICNETLQMKSLKIAELSMSLNSQVGNMQSIMNTLRKGNFLCFSDIFKNAMMIENKVSSIDLYEIMAEIIKVNALSIVPEICDCLANKSYYSEALSKVFIKYHNELRHYKEIILNCLWSMLKPDTNSSFINFIEACLCVNDWNRIWSGVLSENPNYKFDEKYFNQCMAIFQNFETKSFIINQDTMLIIIPYILKNYADNYESYISDIWLYCVSKTHVTSEIDYKIPQQILDKVIEKLIVMKNPLFSFIMKMLSNNWTLMCNKTFNAWFSQIVSDKSDVKRCLLIIKESMDTVNKNNDELNNHFLLLVINVMSHLNKRFMFQCTKGLFEYFIRPKSALLSTFLSSRSDKLLYKWIIVECLISLAEYQIALDIMREFEVAKDLEKDFVEYNKVKDVLLKLVWHLLYIQNWMLAIDLFSDMFSTFIFYKNVDSSCIANCNEIFDFVVIKSFESNDMDVAKRMISLLDYILTVDVDFNVSKDSMRYLLVTAVRTNIPFTDLLDLIDCCFKLHIFENIQTSTDGLGSFLDVYSNLTVEEVSVVITWLCRQAKVKLVTLAQEDGATIKDKLMKVCRLQFILRPTSVSDAFSKKVGAAISFSDFLYKFKESLNSPKYLSCPIKFTINDDDIDNEAKIICDNRIIYNAIYYSDI